MPHLDESAGLEQASQAAFAQMNESPDEATEAAEPASDPSPASEPTAPELEATSAPARSARPWDKDLETFPEEHRGAFSDYLNTQWQPRMTKIEQELSEWRDAFEGNSEHRDLGARVIKAFAEDYRRAYIELGVELDLLDPKDIEGWEDEASYDDATATDPDASDDSRLTDEEKEILSWAREQREQSERDANALALTQYYEALRDEYGLQEGWDEKLFDTLFTGSGADEERTVELYRQYVAGGRALSEPAPKAPKPTAPKVLDHTTGGTPPPEQVEAESLEDASRLFLAQLRAQEGRG